MDSSRSVPLKVAMYLRVSTFAQNTENQRVDLERVAALRGWSIVEIYTDHGISGAKGRGDRPDLDRMLKDAVRGKFKMIAVWSLDRLGRSLQHLIETVNELQAVGVDLYLHQQALDTTTSAGKLAFSIFGAFSEFER
jgi:DNA invertase Pin-like site-specific DNA recombinase